MTGMCSCTVSVCVCVCVCVCACVCACVCVCVCVCTCVGFEPTRAQALGTFGQNPQARTVQFILGGRSLTTNAQGNYYDLITGTHTGAHARIHMHMRIDARSSPHSCVDHVGFLLTPMVVLCDDVQRLVSRSQ